MPRLLSKLGKWVKVLVRHKKHPRGPHPDGSLAENELTIGFNLPMELVIEIAIISGCSSQESYRTFLLVSKDFKAIIEKECIPYLPIRLETTSKIVAFHKLMVSRPDLAQRVQHLWIRGARSRQKPKQGYSEPTSSTWRQFKASAFEQLHIIHSCTNLVSLACSFPVMFLCFRFTKDIFFKHDQLRELTLFENWNLWSCFALEPPIEGPHLFLQLTHLTILDSVAPHFPTKLFPSLRYFSAEIYPASLPIAREAFGVDQVLMAPLPPNVQPLPDNVNVTLLMVNQNDMGVKRVIGDADRSWMMRVGNPLYFRWWSQRIGGEQGIWSDQ